MAASEGPLKGVKVLDLSRILAGTHLHAAAGRSGRYRHQDRKPGDRAAMIRGNGALLTPRMRMATARI